MNVVTEDTVIRGLSALCLIASIAIIAALFNPLSVPVEIEIALPVGFLFGVGAITLWYRAKRR